MIRAVALLLLTATPAAAHGTLPGAGGFAGGFVHPFLATDHLLLLAGVGLALGKQGSRWPLLGLSGGLITGFGLTLVQVGGVQVGGVQPAIVLLALAVGGVLAAAVPVGLAAGMVMAIGAGLLVGADTDVPVGGAAAIIGLAGVAVGVFLVVLNAMALGQLGAHRLNGVALRVAGSWIAAAAILVLAFLVRGGAA